ncbi:MAG: GNAT family N-acetyltransferase [Phycisphaeraceae bacterium]
MPYHYKLMSSAKDGGKFWEKMGPFFASPEVRKAIGGYPMNDSKSMVWLVAIDKRRFDVAGFVSLEAVGERLRMRDAYVCPESRGKGVFSELLGKCLHYARQQEAPIETRAPAACREILSRAGLSLIREVGKHWVDMETEHAK